MTAEELFAAGHHLEFWGSVEDLPEIERLYRAAATAGSVEAMARLGLLVEGELRATMEARDPGTGLGNLKEAAEWYELAAEAGHAQAAYFLGRLYARKLGDWSRAEPWYRKAAEGGNDAAHKDLAEGPEGLLRRRHQAAFLRGDVKEPPPGSMPLAAPAKTGCVVLGLLPLLLIVLAIVTKTA